MGGNHNIIFVSRLDRDCSLGAKMLCKIAPKLHEKYPDLKITIVGGGSDYDEISRLAEKVNVKVNQKLILMVGSADNPSKYFENQALFVGVSRAALEACALGLPCLLLGNEGKLGILDETNFEAASKSNFCCR